MDYIESGMASEVKALLREKTEDRHDIFLSILVEEFQNPSPDRVAQACLLDTQQPRLKDVWWVFYLDKQFFDKAKEAMRLSPWYSFPAPPAASSYWEPWADVKAKLSPSHGEQEAWKGRDSWSGGSSWTGGDSWSGGWSS